MSWSQNCGTPASALALVDLQLALHSSFTDVLFPLHPLCGAPSTDSLAVTGLILSPSVTILSSPPSSDSFAVPSQLDNVTFLNPHIHTLP